MNNVEGETMTILRFQAYSNIRAPYAIRHRV